MDRLMPSDGGTRRVMLPQADMERRGRLRSFRQTLSTATALLVVMGLPWLVATDHRTAPAGLAQSTSARLFLASAALFVVAVGFHAVRAYELAAMYRHWCADRGRPRSRRTALWGTGLVAAGGGLMLAEIGLFWWGPAQGRLPLSRPVLTVAMWSLIAVGLALLWLACWVPARELGRARGREPSATVESFPTWTHEPDRRRDANPSAGWVSDEATSRRPFGTVIACSGGGIRSAAFCLGGLQVLSERHHYDAARYVVGVSGGGYVASAMHVLRARAGFVPRGEGDVPAFAPSTAEEAWLRRNTRNLLENAQVAALGVLAITFGVAVNCFLLGLALLAGAWWLAWLYVVTGAVSGLGSADPHYAGYHGDWAWLSWSGLLPALALLVYVLADAVDRLWPLPAGWRPWIRRISAGLLWAGLGAVALLVGLPALLVGLGRLAGETGAAAVLAQALVGGPDGRSGPPTGPISFLTVLTAVLTVLTAIRARIPSASGPGASRLTRLKAQLVARLLPWTALAVIVVVGVALVVHWIAALVTDPSRLADIRHAWMALVALAALTLMTDANRTSLHYFYRERLSQAFILERGADGSVGPVDYAIPLRFSVEAPGRVTVDDRPGTGRGPELISCAVANAADTDLVPADRNCVPFTFTHDSIGLSGSLFPTRARTPSRLFELHADRRCRVATIPAAMAMSGAAVSPVAGRFTRRLAPYRIVMALANARLGVWLPNPLWVDSPSALRRLIRLRLVDEVRSYYADFAREHAGGDPGARPRVADLGASDAAWLERVLASPPGAAGEVTERARWRWRLIEVARAVQVRPGFLRLAKEAMGRNSVYDRFLYITDGGHYDNLGLVESLRHRPRDVIVLDASSDPEDSFQVLGEAIATARMDLGVEIDLDPSAMIRKGAEPATVAYGQGEVRYRDGETAVLHYVKALVWQDLRAWDVKAYHRGHPDFPRTSTTNQLYGEFDLEAYRMLGREGVTAMLASITPARRSATSKKSRRPPVPQRKTRIPAVPDVVPRQWAGRAEPPRDALVSRGRGRRAGPGG